MYCEMQEYWKHIKQKKHHKAMHALIQLIGNNSIYRKFIGKTLEAESECRTYDM